ncbi:MAG: FliM/FliN family flagellar motor switch protein [Planctomycetota bacterium]
MTLRPFDFREIAAMDDSAVVIRNWLSKSTSFFSEDWVDATGYSAKLSLAGIKTESYDTMLEKIPREDLCCSVDIPDRLSSMWYAPVPQLRVVAADLLCQEELEEEGPSDLTLVEADLVQFFIERLAESLGQGWMGDSELSIELGELGKDARKLRLFRGNDLVTNIAIEIECRVGKAVLNWLVPKAKFGDMLDDTVDNRSGEHAASPPKEMVGRLPVEVVTLLGSAKISMAKLPHLKPGQLIILDQRIDDPLTSTVDEKPTFECWPGRLGNQQAVQVAGPSDPS